jgi:hypothetical protein
MRPVPPRISVLLLFAVLCLVAGLASPVRAQLATVNLCADGAGNIGTNWISLPTLSDMMTAEDLCLSIPGATAVSQGVSDSIPATSLRWSYDCATGICTSSQPIPEPGCPGACFCLAPGEGIEATVAADTRWGVNICEVFASITLPPGFQNYLISIPYGTAFATANDLAVPFYLPNTGITRGTVSRIDCATGVLSTCNVGTAACDAMTLQPGQAYRIRYPTPTTGLTFLNPIACNLALPAAATCPISDLTFGSDTAFSWTAPAGCPLPALYDSIRGDISCLRRACRQSVASVPPACAGCVLLEDDDVDTTTVDAGVPALGQAYWYHARVDGGTWREGVGPASCIDRDALFAGGCP